MSTALSEYFPFATGLGSNVTEAEWREMARLWLPTGIIPSGDSALNELAVAQRAAGANMSVDVATGWAWILGCFGSLAALTNVAVSANASGNPRVDLVVLRADFVNDIVELDVLVGTPAAAPVEPALTQSSSMWEIPLAALDVASGAVSVVTANIRDRRTFARSLPEAANKEPVRVATTAALAASTVTGTTRVANANGALGAIDGVTLVAGERLLDKNHATTAQRGLWRVVDPGSASRPWVLERPPDFDSSSDVRGGVWVKVTEGTVAADTGWLLTTNDPITLGTTGLTFTQFPATITADPAGALVATQETTTSTTYAALATPGPIATFVVPASGNVVVTLGAEVFVDTASDWGYMSVVLSSGNTLAAADARSMHLRAASTNIPVIQVSMTFYLSGLTPGSTVFTAQYRTTGTATATFQNRTIKLEAAA